MKIYQFSCREIKGIDTRQADAVLRHKPDVIFWEAPSSTDLKATLVFDPRKTIAQLQGELNSETRNLRLVSKKSPWVVSDIKTYENTFDLLKLGNKVRMYNVDAPSELLIQTTINKWNLIDKPRRRGVHLMWWVYIYLRERMMANNLAPLLKTNKQKGLMFMQKFHWLNVKFLLSNPTKNQIWEYYFGRFNDVDRKNISNTIKARNAVLYKYWLRHSDFV